MKRIALYLAILIVLSTTLGCTIAWSRLCVSHREAIRNGHNAMDLTLRSGAGTAQYEAGKKFARQTVTTPAPAQQPAGPDTVTAGNRAMTRQPVAGRQSALSATTQPHKPSPDLLVTQLKPGHSFSQELIRRLGDRPVVAAVINYAKEKWHLPARLPTNSRCTLAMLPSDAGKSRDHFVYIQIEYHGRRQRIYHYVDSFGHSLIISSGGHGFRVLEPLAPVSGARISSGWGWRIQPVLGGDEFHRGIDYAAPPKTPVRATLDGVVAIREWHGNYGRLVEIKHAGGLLTRYGHLSAFDDDVLVGSHVRRGQIIGYVGTSGLSTGPHLYYEVWDHGKRIDPLLHTGLLIASNLSSLERLRFRDYVTSVSARLAP